MSVKRMKAVVNPASAAGKTRAAWPEIERLARGRGIAFEAAFTEGPGHATALTREALQAGHQTIVAVGGDGTVHEVVNGFFAEDRAINPAAALGVIARGTGCDFIRSLCIPKSAEAAVATLAGGRWRVIDVGRCEYVDHGGETSCRYFANVGGAGIGGAVSARVNRGFKGLGGRVSFFVSALGTLLTYRGHEMEVVLDDRVRLSGRYFGVIVANGRSFGGGMQIAPDARMDDAVLNVVTLGDLRRFEVLGSFLRVYRGTHGAHPKVHFYQAQKVTVHSDKTCLLDLDGEQPGHAEALFTLLPSALRVICGE